MGVRVPPSAPHTYSSEERFFQALNEGVEIIDIVGTSVAGRLYRTHVFRLAPWFANIEILPDRIHTVGVGYCMLIQKI
ncbi:MAG: hypothetical protein WCJ88_03025 [Actinomycetes bacterium]